MLKALWIPLSDSSMAGGTDDSFESFKVDTLKQYLLDCEVPITDTQTAMLHVF